MLPGNRVATLFRLETCAPEDLPALTAELAALLPPWEQPELRQDFLDMERRWLSLARSYEFAERLASFPTPIKRK